MRVLGIETSCDETGVAIYDSCQGLMAEALYSQTALHADYGGVVPELASRDHVRKLLPMIRQVLRNSGIVPDELDGIAYTAGPGLAGALMVGASLGRTLAWAWDKPALAVHHMEGHLLAPMLEPDPPGFPFLALLVSGGHTQLVAVPGPGVYRLLGESLDDAAGEAFDKVAKMLKLGYPGGPAVAREAEQGNAARFRFPRPMTDRPGLEMSFSGLKTHTLNLVSRHLDDQGRLDSRIRADIAAGFQEAVADTLVIKCRRALASSGFQRLVIAGGVGANQRLRQKLAEMVARMGGRLYFPRQAFCTDNGAMIAYAGCQRLLAGEKSALAIQVRPRWSLEDLPAHGKA